VNQVPGSRSLLDLQQDERRRIAAQVHDDPIQVLSVAVMRLDLLGERIDDNDANAKLDDARTAVSSAIEHLRTMQSELVPPALERAGLAAAFDEYATQLFANSEVVVDVASDVDREPSYGVRGAIFRIAREAIANTHEHAQASRVEIRVGPADGGFVVRISDDGHGFAPAAAQPQPGHGLEFSADLARSAGGSWSISTTSGEGTSVEFWLPDA
jgi:signal transduction histidine kinase